MEEWKNYKLSDVASFRTGKLDSNAAKPGGKYPFFTCSPETLRINDYAFDQRAILLAGNNAEGNFSIKYYEGKFNAYQRTYVISVEESIANIKFVYYALRLCLRRFKQMSQGTSTKFLTMSILNSFEIELPSLETQDKIVNILLGLDNKIELNNRINHNLEEQAQAIFDSVFDNPIKEKTLHLDSIAEINPKRTLTKGANARCIDMSYLSNSGSFPSGWEYRQYSGGMKFINGDTLMARITPCLENGKVAYVNFLEEDEVAFGSTEYIVFHGKNGFPDELFYFLTRNKNFIDYATKNMNGSSGRQRVSGETIGQYLIPGLSDEEIERIRISSKAAMTEILRNSLESMNLKVIRDSLLPRLMSGKLNC